ncbi:MAG: hypothetical protein ACOYT4_02950 [Nanoarchaeota archaeon]
MEFKILKKEKNPLLYREELTIEVISSSTPNKEEIINKLEKSNEVAVIKSINGTFGTSRFNIDAIVYDSAEHKNNIEIIPKKVRKKMEEERKKLEQEKQKAQEEAKREA